MRWVFWPRRRATELGRQVALVIGKPQACQALRRGGNGNHAERAGHARLNDGGVKFHTGLRAVFLGCLRVCGQVEFLQFMVF